MITLSPTGQYTRGLLSGICSYGHTKIRWNFHLEQIPQNGIVSAKRIQPDGILAFCYDEEFAARIKKLNIPAVNLSSQGEKSALPTVRIDNKAVGVHAAKHLLDRGFDNYAVCGRVDKNLFFNRNKSFENTVMQAGYPCHKLSPWPVANNNSNGKQPEKILRWLRQLPKPLALFAYSDMMAISMVTACVQAGLKVPDDVAVLGTDNDEIMCQLTTPPVSSVSLPHEQIGYSAAALLDKLMTQKQHLKPEEMEQLFPPTHVVTRASTDIIAVNDSKVAKALRYIRENRDKPIDVEDVVKTARMSRRGLELRFTRAINQTIFSQIRSAHIHQASFLLRKTNWTIEHIADESGFNSGARLWNVFHRQTGMTPGEYRKQFVHMKPERKE